MYKGNNAPNLINSLYLANSKLNPKVLLDLTFECYRESNGANCYNNLQGAFFNCSSQFSVPKWKMMGSQSEILFHEILNVQKILVGWKTFFYLALKFGRNS